MDLPQCRGLGGVVAGRVRTASGWCSLPVGTGDNDVWVDPGRWGRASLETESVNCVRGGERPGDNIAY